MNHISDTYDSTNTSNPIEEETREYGFLNEAMDERLDEDSEDDDEVRSTVDDDPDDLDEDEV